MGSLSLPYLGAKLQGGRGGGEGRFPLKIEPEGAYRSECPGGEGQSPKKGEVGTNLWVNLLQGVEEGLKGGATKVGDGAQAREQTPVQHLLEVPLTDVLVEE